jgi:hypothetical protein
MSDNFTSFSQQFSQFVLSTNQTNLVLDVLMNDLLDTMNITALRANQVFHLYEYASGWFSEDKKWREKQLAQAINSMIQAQEIVKIRECQYRVPADRIAGWGLFTPTSYDYAYLWTVRSLFFWFRDLGKALDQEFDALSPCYRFLSFINSL